MKLRIFIYSMFICFIALIQTTLVERFKILGIKPNLMMIFIVCVALLKGNVEGAIVGFFIGLIHDVLSGKILGFYSLLGLYLGIVIGSANRRLYRENIVLIVFFTFISTILYEWAVYFFNTFLHGEIDWFYPIKGIILPEAIYNSIISIFIYIAVIKMDLWIEDRNKDSRKY